MSNIGSWENTRDTKKINIDIIVFVTKEVNSMHLNFPTIR